jgi:hypothetical protein
VDTKRRFIYLEQPMARMTLMAQQMGTLKACLTDSNGNVEGHLTDLDGSAEGRLTDLDGNAEGLPD